MPLSRRHAPWKRDFMLFTSGFILPRRVVDRSVNNLLEVESNIFEVYIIFIFSIIEEAKQFTNVTATVNNVAEILI